MNKQILLLAVVVAVVYSQCAVPATPTLGCTACSGSTCTACDEAANFQPTPIAGQCACVVGFFQDDDDDDVCVACIVGCSNCAYAHGNLYVDQYVCIACHEEGNFVANGSSCRCADGYYLDVNDLCQVCNPAFGDTCTTCSSTTCLTCSGDNAVAAGATVCSKKCSIDRCVTCFNSTVCSQCTPNSVLSLSQATCTCATPGFFSTSTACTACIANCDVCAAATGCTTCSQGFVFSSITSTCVAFESHVKLVLSLLVIAVLAFAM